MTDKELKEATQEIDHAAAGGSLELLKRQILPQAFASMAVFCKLFFPNRFRKEFDDGHYELFELIDEKRRADGTVWSYQKAGATVFRGAGKTSIIALALPAREVLFRQRNYIVYVNNNSDTAIFQTENLRRELVANQRIKKLFGDVRANEVDGLDEAFGKKCWVANGQTFVLPRGSGQQVRGLLFRDYRPDLIIVDDLEDTNEMGEIVRKKRENWLFSDLFMSVDASEDNWRLFYIDTLKHRQAIPNKLKNLSDWKFINIPLCTDDFKTLFPHFVPQEKLDTQIAQSRESGTMYLFYREKLGKIVHGDEQVFKPEYFKYYSEIDNDFSSRPLQTIVIIDPAKTTNIASAHSAIVGVGIDTMANKIYVRDIDHGKFHPEDIYQRAFSMAKLLGARTIGYEVTGLNEFITHPFRNAMHESGLNFELIELKPRRGKEELLIDLDLPEKAHRVGAMLPYYRKGQIYHNKDCRTIGALESQLLDFPEPDLWDVCDALSYFIPMMEEGLRYFGFTRGDGISDASEDEFEILKSGYSPALKMSNNVWQKRLSA